MTPEPSLLTGILAGAAAEADAIGNLTQGLIGALIGAVIGAGIALIAGFRLQSNDFDRRARGAARAVADECRTNAVKIRMALEYQDFQPLSRAVFDALAAEVGVSLSGPAFMKVGVAYSSQLEYFMAQQAKDAGALTLAHAKSLRSLLRITREARAVLNDRGWTKEEYAELKDAAEEDKQKLALDV